MANNQLPVNGNVERSALSPDFVLKAGLAKMLKGGVIMDVVNADQVCILAFFHFFFHSFPSFFFLSFSSFFPLSHHLGEVCVGLFFFLFLLSFFYYNTLTNFTQARIAEEAGAVAVMALERVPADIRVEGGVSRMSDPKMIKEIMAAVTIPVMAKARIGHFVECQVSFLLLFSFFSLSLSPSSSSSSLTNASA